MTCLRLLVPLSIKGNVSEEVTWVHTGSGNPGNPGKFLKPCKPLEKP